MRIFPARKPGTRLIPTVAFRLLVCALLLLAFRETALPGDYISSPEQGWPQFRGPMRNGIAKESGLLQSWPTNGPPVLWSVTNIGLGYSAPIINRGTVYLTGDVGEELHIFAYDLDGKVIWKSTNGAAWKTPYPGSRASCTFSAGKLYHLNGHGRATCFSAANGEPLWTVDILERFETKKPTWGFAENLLVDGDRVFVTLGGRKGSVAALDKNTGKTLWITEPLPANTEKPEGPAYAPPILINIHGQKHLVAVTARHFLGINADTGALQWSLEMPTSHEVLGSSPVLCGDGLFVTGPDGGGGKFLRLTQNDGRISAEPAWTNSLDTCHGGIVCLDGFLYGSWYRSFNGWGCASAIDGTVRYRDREMAMGSCVYADGRLYCLSQTGTMALVDPNPEKWNIVSRFQFVQKHQNNVWAHPVILNGRLYLRYQNEMTCFNIRR